MKPLRFLPACVASLSAWVLPSFAALAQLPADAYPGLRTADGALLPSIAGYLGSEVRQEQKPLDPKMLDERANFGYSPEEIQKYFSAPVNMVLDETGLDRSFLKAPPAPGVHPRVLFNPEDLPALRERLKNTEAGRSAMGAIRERVAAMITGPEAKFALDYQRLQAGELIEKLDNNVAYCLMYEAFRCLVDDDQEGGKKVAAAITTLARIADREIDANRANPRNAGAQNDARVISQGPTREFSLGLDYDFAYNFMTPEQRDVVRKALVKATEGMTGIGCETLHALQTGASNWISWGCRALFAITAIEGEEGYDHGTFERFANAQINFINAMYPTGEAFEGWGKNFMFFEHMIIIAKRSKDLNVIGHQNVRAAYNNYFIASLSPWGNNFTFCDSLARSGCKIARNADVQMYHTLFPKDVAGNFIFRNQISSDYANVGPKTINTHHPFATMDALMCAIFASDIAPAPASEEYVAVTKDRPLTYFSADTCNMITRSAWEPDALYLNYLNRALPGGHQYSDRSHFNLYGDGRFWSIYQGSRQIKEQYGPIMRSVVMADGQGPSTAEARAVNFVDKPLATFMVTDLSTPWNFQTSGLEKPPAGTPTGPKTWSYNDFRLTPSPLAWMSLPISQLPDWYSSEKPEAGKGDWYRRFTMKKAFRTIGLVRGKHPYTLIVDDVQIDDQPHEHVWGMTMPPDVQLESVKTLSKQPGAASADILLAETDKPDLSVAAASELRRKLFVRVLSADKLEDTPAVVENVNVPNPPQRDVVLNRLHIKSASVNPGYKLLLFAHREGEPLPKTAWNKSRTAVMVTWPDQTDIISFAPGKDGRTLVRVERKGGETVEVL